MEQSVVRRGWTFESVRGLQKRTRISRVFVVSDDAGV